MAPLHILVFLSNLNSEKISLTTVFICFITSFFLKCIYRRWKYRHLPSMANRYIDILGNLRYFPTHLIGYCNNSITTYQSLYMLGYLHLFKNVKLCVSWYSYAPYVYLSKADSVEAAISGTKHLEKASFYKFFHALVNTGLFTSPGRKWKIRRRLLNHSFHFDILNEFISVFNVQSQVLVQCFRNEICKNFTSIVEPITLCSLDIICETILGVQIDAQKNGNLQFIASMKRSEELMIKRTTNPLHWFNFIYQFTADGKEMKRHINITHTFTRQVILERKRQLMCDKKRNFETKKKILMDTLLYHHLETSQLTEEEIRDEILTFIIGGYDTTAMGISWTLYLIGLHKDVQEKIHEELDAIFVEDFERNADIKDINNMTYLDCVLKESHRLYPPVPFIGRSLKEETVIDGHLLPKGATLLVILYSLHRDEAVFPDAERFDPDRFLPASSVGRHPFAYIPFSSGPRNCIGQRFGQLEEKVVVSYILRNYELESLDARDKLPPAFEVTLKCAFPIRIRIRPRRANTIL